MLKEKNVGVCGLGVWGLGDIAYIRKPRATPHTKHQTPHTKHHTSHPLLHKRILILNRPCSLLLFIK